MKRISSIVFASMLFILACQKKDNDVAPVASTNTTTNTTTPAGLKKFARLTPEDGFSKPIHKDDANLMINSYLTSVGYPGTDDKIRSFSYDAGVLLDYLNDPTHDKIVSVKFMLAHPLDYVNSGNYGVNGGLNPGALTLVIVGVNSDGQYVFSNGNYVLDFAMACPYQCPASLGPTL